MKTTEPNQAPETRYMLVTPAASHLSRQARICLIFDVRQRMKHVRYTSSGNTVGLKETIEDYWEIADDGHVIRSIILQLDGLILKYDSSHDADSFGVLPEGIIEDAMLTDVSFGKAIQISHAEFESLWSKKAKNENHGA